ncbi:hypothetical protein G5I_04300 [Acromyrmex echinatior]|uniref:Uncharacterized protein n=1 Tax=Acromyrmex echinatior TaxID=103372 RepID=F4WF93_ACREC|nr:hypothetical protein G5I_04300 [Acromyrmex echinatior]
MCKISIWDIRSSGYMYGIVRCTIESTAAVGIDNLVLAILNRHDYDSERLLSLYSYLSCEQYIALCRASNPYLIVPQILIEWQQTLTLTSSRYLWAAALGDEGKWPGPRVKGKRLQKQQQHAHTIQHAPLVGSCGLFVPPNYFNPGWYHLVPQTTKPSIASLNVTRHEPDFVD